MTAISVFVGLEEWGPVPRRCAWHHQEESVMTVMANTIMLVNTFYLLNFFVLIIGSLFKLLKNGK